MKLIFATGNQGKMKEIRMILAGLSLEIQSMKEANIDIEVEENGKTFEENAKIKALAIWNYLKEQGEDNCIVMADDSGLEVDAMDKQPGVHSARFMGEDTSYVIKNQAILDKLEGLTGQERSARFVCTIATVYPNGRVTSIRETIEGEIAKESSGENGFGYDPIFYVPAYGCTTAELSLEQKNEISHRGKALSQARVEIERFLQEGEENASIGCKRFSWF